MVLVHPLHVMPNVSSRYEGLGVGFAPYLQPPGPEVVRWTVGEPGFNTPSEIINAAIKAVSYTHLRAHETRSKSRMPSSA